MTTLDDILTLMQRRAQPIQAPDIADEFGIDVTDAISLLLKLHEQGAIDKTSRNDGSGVILWVAK